FLLRIKFACFLADCGPVMLAQWQQFVRRHRSFALAKLPQGRDHHSGIAVSRAEKRNAKIIDLLAFKLVHAVKNVGLLARVWRVVEIPTENGQSSRRPRPLGYFLSDSTVNVVSRVLAISAPPGNKFFCWRGRAFVGQRLCEQRDEIASRFGPGF